MERDLQENRRNPQRTRPGYPQSARAYLQTACPHPRSRRNASWYHFLPDLAFAVYARASPPINAGSSHRRAGIDEPARRRAGIDEPAGRCRLGDAGSSVPACQPATQPATQPASPLIDAGSIDERASTTPAVFILRGRRASRRPEINVRWLYSRRWQQRGRTCCTREPYTASDSLN